MPEAHIRTITELDAARILELRNRLPGRAAYPSALTELIEWIEQEADIVPGERVEADLVTINSTVSFRDELTESVHRVTVVYPQEMSVGARRISVLSPVGRALLGSRAGDVVHVGLPDGSSRALRVLEVHYQPEAAGHFAR
jgi:regulator of nucleoside diphosphate kinase